jgi:hypothetical protein
MYWYRLHKNGGKIYVYVICIYLRRSPDNAVGIATGCGLDIRGPRIFFLNSVQTGSGANPASNPIGTEGKAAGT